MKRGNVWIAVALISAAACGGYSSGPPSQTPGNTTPPAGGISVSNNAFSPATLNVQVGATVVWAWNTCTGDPYTGSQTCANHNVIFDDGSTSSSTQDQGTFSKIFNTAGTFTYHCTLHPMTGTVVVQ
jgi:plastocyanin